MKTYLYRGLSYLFFFSVDVSTGWIKWRVHWPVEIACCDWGGDRIFVSRPASKGSVTTETLTLCVGSRVYCDTVLTKILLYLLRWHSRLFCSILLYSTRTEGNVDYFTQYWCQHLLLLPVFSNRPTFVNLSLRSIKYQSINFVRKL